jgi:hypothetical protein
MLNCRLEREHAVLSTQQTEKITSLTQDIETQNQTNNENEVRLGLLRAYCVCCCLLLWTTQLLILNGVRLL